MYMRSTNADCAVFLRLFRYKEADVGTFTVWSTNISCSQFGPCTAFAVSSCKFEAHDFKVGVSNPGIVTYHSLRMPSEHSKPPESGQFSEYPNVIIIIIIIIIISSSCSSSLLLVICVISVILCLCY